MKYQLIAGVLLTFFTTTSVSAFTPSAVDLRNSIEEKREVFKESRDAIKREILETRDRLKDAYKEERKEIIGEKCTRLTTEIDRRIAKFEQNHQGRVKQFKNIETRVKEYIAKLKTQGVDVSVLEADLVKLTELIKQFDTDHATYIAKLKATKEYACGESQGKFKEALKAARDAQKVMVTSAKATLEFVKTTLKPQLDALKTQVTPRISPAISVPVTSSEVSP